MLGFVNQSFFRGVRVYIVGDKARLEFLGDCLAVGRVVNVYKKLPVIDKFGKFEGTLRFEVIIYFAVIRRLSSVKLRYTCEVRRQVIPEAVGVSNDLRTPDTKFHREPFKRFLDRL